MEDGGFGGVRLWFGEVPALHRGAESDLSKSWREWINGEVKRAT